MKARHLVCMAMGSLLLSGAALAEDSKGTGATGDGGAKITKEEFMKRAEARFAHMDVNKDGVIDASDRAKLREQMQNCAEMMGGMGMMGNGMMGNGMMGGGMMGGGMMGNGMMGGGMMGGMMGRPDADEAPTRSAP